MKLDDVPVVKLWYVALHLVLYDCSALILALQVPLDFARSHVLFRAVVVVNTVPGDGTYRMLDLCRRSGYKIAILYICDIIYLIYARDRDWHWNSYLTRWCGNTLSCDGNTIRHNLN